MLRRPHTARAWWCLGTSAARGDLLVAPAGEYAATWRPLAAFSDLAAALGAGPDEIAAAEGLGLGGAWVGRTWIEVEAPALVGALGLAPAGPARVVTLPIPSPGGRRALLVGSRRPTGGLGPRALEGAAGLRLARAVGLGDLSALVGTFETVNALEVTCEQLAVLMHERDAEIERERGRRG